MGCLLSLKRPVDRQNVHVVVFYINVVLSHNSRLFKSYMYLRSFEGLSPYDPEPEASITILRASFPFMRV